LFGGAECELLGSAELVGGVYLVVSADLVWIADSLGSAGFVRGADCAGETLAGITGVVGNGGAADAPVEVLVLSRPAAFWGGGRRCGGMAGSALFG
jgi:hypothetical protein